MPFLREITGSFNPYGFQDDEVRTSFMDCFHHALLVAGLQRSSQ